MDVFINQIIFLTLISLTSSGIVKWLPNSSFNVPTNFRDGKLPCSKKTVVFPEFMSGSVGLESIMDVGALVLPDDGEIILDNAVISLGQDIGDSNCTDGNSYYLDKAISSWTQADVWSSVKFNEATPDNERIPCYNDIVQFPSNTKYTVRLPNEEQFVRDINMGNSSLSSKYNPNLWFMFYILRNQTDRMGQFVLNNYFSPGVKILEQTCKDHSGCPCQKNPPTIDCSSKFCPEPACVESIKPTGFCCSLCGGYIDFEIDEGFDMTIFKELVDKSVEGYDSNIVYHIGFSSVSPRKKIQLVIVEKGEFTGSSMEAINVIDKSVHSHWYKGEKLSQISGAPLYKRHLGVKLFVSTFFAVIIMLGVIYLFYYRLPAVTLPAGLRGLRGRYRENFFRYQMRSDSVVSLTRRDSSVMPVPRTAFRNPLYDSKRGRVQVEETAVEES